MWRFVAALLIVLGITIHAGHGQLCTVTNDIGELSTTMRAQLYLGQQTFAMSMLSAILKATPHENIFFSPYSTYHALLLAYFGAQNESEEELVRALQLSWSKSKDHVRRSYRLEKQVRNRRAKTMPLEFASADKIFFDKHVNLTECINSVLIEELESMDFRSNAEQCRKDINGWIATLTRNEIPEMLNSGDVSGETELLLANAAYFKGQWESQFDTADTKQAIFFTTPTKQSFVPTMHKRGTYELTIDDQLGAYVLQMPYKTSLDESKESEICMVIILPPFTNNSLETVLSKLTPETLQKALKESVTREMDITMPKFEFEQNLELVPILRHMGINSIFDQNADLSGFSTSQKLMFGDAKHVAKIKVDEEGSTAAAATVLFSFRSARPVEPTKLELNHPFLFLIYDRIAGAILFTGIYRDPMTQ